MANWATTHYVIEGNDKQLQHIYDTMKNVIDGCIKPDTTASDGWEGNVILALGGTWEESEYMRGFISECEFYNGILSFVAEEAWGATDFRHALRRIIPDIKIFYMVEEPGLDVYATNDVTGKYFTERYYVDCCVNGEDYSEYFSDMDDVFKYLKDFSIENEDDITAFNENKEDEDDYIYLHEFEYVD